MSENVKDRIHSTTKSQMFNKMAIDSTKFLNLVSRVVSTARLAFVFAIDKRSLQSTQTTDIPTVCQSAQTTGGSDSYHKIRHIHSARF
jgi:hypothetical protein